MFLNRQGSGNSPVKFPYFKSSGHFCDFHYYSSQWVRIYFFLNPQDKFRSTRNLPCISKYKRFLNG